MGVSNIQPAPKDQEDALRDLGIAVIFGLFLIGGLVIGASLADDGPNAKELKQPPPVARQAGYVDDPICPREADRVKVRGRSGSEAVARLSNLLEKSPGAVWAVEEFPKVNQGDWVAPKDGADLPTSYQVFRDRRLVGEIFVKSVGKRYFVAAVTWRC